MDAPNEMPDERPSNLQEEELLVLEVRRTHQVVDVRLEVGLLVHADDGGDVERAGARAEVAFVVAAVVEGLLQVEEKEEARLAIISAQIYPGNNRTLLASFPTQETPVSAGRSM